MKYEVFEKFFADTRRHFGLEEISERSVEGPLRQLQEVLASPPDAGKPGQWTYRHFADRAIGRNR